MRIAEIAYPIPVDRTFDYEVPESLAARLAPGARVRAPFGPRASLSGVVMSVRSGESLKPLKALSAIMDSEPILSEESLALARWLSSQYCAPLGECLKIILPSNLREARRQVVGVGTPLAKAALSSREAGNGLNSIAGARAQPSFELTPGQACVLQALEGRLSARVFCASLIFGVPASGKTEVYLRLIRQAVKESGQALFLVPEISLTQPFFEDFSAALGLPVVLWHSRLGAVKRQEAWLGLRSGDVRVVIGARSACLLPFKDLRLAVIDEEQDESYKEDGKAPYYHARDVVMARARRFGAVVVLGSATPSMETLAGVRAGAVNLLEMKERVAKSTPPPPVRILAAELGQNIQVERGLMDALLDRIKDRLAKREQVILLVNRRGYSNFVMCRRCGWVDRCPDCAVAFIHHQLGDGFFLMCHHCGRRAEVPLHCGKCNAGGPLRFSGLGTQKIVAELKSLLPGVRVLRMDSDTVSPSKKNKDEGIYRQFKEKKADILVGTKLVAKGFHFPDVTLVGVVDADSHLHMPDFRSAERTAQMLMQVAGRAGRADKPGEVFIQTAQPTHYAIQAVARGDYGFFADQELGFRKELDYPPSATLVRILVAGKTSETVHKAAQKVAGELRKTLAGAQVLGPVPGVYAQFQGLFRYHILLKIKNATGLDAARKAIASLAAPSGVRLKVNVDPYDFF